MAEQSAKEMAEHYEKLTGKALKKVRIAVPKQSFLFGIASDFLEMARNYHSDAVYFKKKKEYATSLAAFSYAHAWLDAGARMGFFETKGDYVLFTQFR